MGVEFVGIELDLRGEEGVYSDLQKIDQLLNSLRGKKKVDAGLQDLKRDILAATGELQKFERKQKSIQKGFKSGSINKTDFWTKQLDEASRGAEKTRRHLQDLRQIEREVNLATRQMGDTFKQTFNKMSSALTHAGSKMQTLGNALQRLTSPFERFTTGLLMGAGYKALGKFTEGLSNGFNRYDTMKKYPKIMAAFGYSAEESAKSIDMLDKSVRGLPTGLDEMVDLTQRFTATTGDLDKGTKLAIATNNAFLASMSTDTQRYQGMMQLQDVLGGKDMNAREWNSLVSSMTPAIVKMGEAMGYTNKNMGEFIQTIRDGKMDNQEFIDQLIKIGNEGGVLEKMAKESKDTWQALFANIGNAASRMTAGTIQALDEVSKAMTGKDVNLFLAESFIPSIDNATASVKEWIKAHPDEIADFFTSLKQIDFKSFGKGIVQGMGDLAKAIKLFADFAGGEDLSKIGRSMIWLNMAGKFLTVFGGLTKGLSYPLAGAGAIIKRGIRSFKRGGILGALGDLIAGESLSNIGTATEKIDKGVPAMGKFSTGLSKVFNGWTKIATMIGGSALVGAVSFKAFKSIFKDIKEIGDIISDTDWDYAGKGLVGIGGFLTTFMGLSKWLGGAAGTGLLKGGGILSGMTLLFSGTFWADMKLIKSGFKSIKDVSEYLNTAIDNFSKVKAIDGGIVGNISNAIGVFNQITELLAIERNNPVTGEGSGGLKELGTKSAETVENLATALTGIKDAASTLNEINGMQVNTSNIDTMMDAIERALTAVGTMINRLPAFMRSGTGADSTGNTSQIMTNIKSIFDIFTGENGILTQIPRINEQIQNLVSGGQLTKLGVQMGTLGNSLKNIWAKLNIGMSDGSFNLQQMTNLADAMYQVRRVIYHLNQIGNMEVNTNGAANIKKAISSIKKVFSETTVGDLKAQINGFVQSIKNALQSLSDLNEEIPINATVKLAPGFQTSVNSVTKTITTAKANIRKLNSAINIRIPVRVTFSISTNLGGALGIIAKARARLGAAQSGVTGDGCGCAMGGMIYRAKGGSIGFPGKPRGVDRVPVWAQAGEFMQRKAAVNFFGIDFMRKVNNLDMRGAMHELMTRAGSMASVGRNTVINNYYNNNQKVTQNINNPSPGFAVNSASRFAGAFK